MSEITRPGNENIEPSNALSPKVTKTTGADVAAVTVKASLGAIPIVGTAVAEIVTAIIPGQRLDRIQDLLELVAEKLNHLEQQTIEEKMKSPEAVDLIEDCFMGAARATSKERISYLANLYVTGITSEEADHERNKKMVTLLSQLSDAEVIWLAHLAQHRASGDPIDKHEEILLPRSAYIGGPTADVDAEAIQQAWVARLLQLGLTKQELQKPRIGELPEIDTFTGDWKRSYTKVTWLGRMLLGYIGIYEPIRGAEVKESETA